MRDVDRQRRACRLAESFQRFRGSTTTPTFYIFPSLPRKIGGDEAKEAAKQREGADWWVDGGWRNGSYFGNPGSQEWAGVVLTALFSHSIVTLIVSKQYKSLLRPSWKSRSIM